MRSHSPAPGTFQNDAASAVHSHYTARNPNDGRGAAAFFADFVRANADRFVVRENATNRTDYVACENQATAGPVVHGGRFEMVDGAGRITLETSSGEIAFNLNAVPGMARASDHLMNVVADIIRGQGIPPDFTNMRGPRPPAPEGPQGNDPGTEAVLLGASVPQNTRRSPGGELPRGDYPRLVQNEDAGDAASGGGNGLARRARARDAGASEIIDAEFTVREPAALPPGSESPLLPPGEAAQPETSTAIILRRVDGELARTGSEGNNSSEPSAANLVLTSGDGGGVLARISRETSGSDLVSLGATNSGGGGGGLAVDGTRYYRDQGPGVGMREIVEQVASVLASVGYLRGIEIRDMNELGDFNLAGLKMQGARISNTSIVELEGGDRASLEATDLTGAVTSGVVEIRGVSAQGLIMNELRNAGRLVIEQSDLRQAAFNGAQFASSPEQIAERLVMRGCDIRGASFQGSTALEQFLINASDTQVLEVFKGTTYDETTRFSADDQVDAAIKARLDRMSGAISTQFADLTGARVISHLQGSPLADTLHVRCGRDNMTVVASGDQFYVLRTDQRGNQTFEVANMATGTWQAQQGPNAGLDTMRFVSNAIDEDAMRRRMAAA